MNKADISCTTSPGQGQPKPGASRRGLLAGTSLTVMLTLEPHATLGETDADRELIAMCEQHAKSIDMVNNCPHDIEDVNDPIYRSWDLARQYISAAKPQTLAGLAAKARAATKEAIQPDGKADFSDGQASLWAKDLVSDILRLSSGDFT